MKKPIIISCSLLLLLVCNIKAFTQTTVKIEYLYDDSGNRYLRREITIQSINAKIDSSTNTNNSDTIANNLGDNISNLSKNDEITSLFTDNIENISITVFPNPTIGILTLKIDKFENTATKLNMFLYGSNGVLIQTQQLLKDNNTISLVGFAPGTYFLKIKSENIEKVYNIVKID